MIKFIISLIISSVFLISCTPLKKPTLNDIYPLDPFEVRVDFTDDITGEYTSTGIVRYYVVYGNISDSLYMVQLLTNFAEEHVDRKLLNADTWYSIEFFKKSSKTKKEFKETHFDQLDYHSDDMFASYIWNGLSRGGIVFYDRHIFSKL